MAPIVTTNRHRADTSPRSAAATPFFAFARGEPSSELPPVGEALREPNGLLAAGGDLEPATLLAAYRRGVFPWYAEGQPILWWSPDPRAVIRPARVHVSRRLARTLRSGRFTTTCDRAFAAVVAGCAAPRDGREGTWITPEMGAAYCRLHRLGHAHSVECWRGEELVGGVYGVAIGRVFFGESMFHRVRDASRVALVTLAANLARWGYVLLDCQLPSDHLARHGAESMPRRRFLAELARAADVPPAIDAWRNWWQWQAAP